MRALPSLPAATMNSGSGENRTFKIVPEEPRNAAISFLRAKSQIRTIWSSPVEANIVPFELKSTDHTSCVCPVPTWQSGCRNRGPRGARFGPSLRKRGIGPTGRRRCRRRRPRGCCRSQLFLACDSIPDLDGFVAARGSQDLSIWGKGVSATFTRPACASAVREDLLSRMPTSQTLTVPLRPPVSSFFPSWHRRPCGTNAAGIGERVSISFCVFKSQIFAWSHQVAPGGKVVPAAGRKCRQGPNRSTMGIRKVSSPLVRPRCPTTSRSRRRFPCGQCFAHPRKWPTTKSGPAFPCENVGGDGDRVILTAFRGCGNSKNMPPRLRATG